MAVDERVPEEEQFTKLFTAREEALVSGRPPEAADPAAPPEVQSRLERDLACEQLLRQVLRPPAAEDRLAPNGVWVLSCYQ
jgi:hypothetical protein